MAVKVKKNTIKEKITLAPELPQYAGYADCWMRTPVDFQVTNGYSEALTLRITAESPEGAIVPYESTLEVPFESSVLLSAELFSPPFFCENDELKKCTVESAVYCEDEEIVRVKNEFVALPYDWWEGTEGNVERLVSFVRPRLNDCARVLDEAGKRLKRWKIDAEFYGYTAVDKNTVRQVIAAIFAALKGYSVENTGAVSLDAPARAAGEGILANRSASPLELAVFAAACLEAAHLHPVIAVGKNAVAVGTWLYDSCFLDSVTDDAEIVSKYISEGINNLSFFDVDDLFPTSNAAFTASEKHFAQKLAAGGYEYFADVHRCRLGGVRPLPLRGKGLRGYELLQESDTGNDEAPAPLFEAKRLKLDGKQPKNKTWERNLLDLTGKNALLNFTGKNALHLFAADADYLYNTLAQKDGLKIKGGSDEAPLFGAAPDAPARELIALEERKGVQRVYCDSKTALEICTRLNKRNKEADEESGAKILYLAFGFLRYVDKTGDEKYAPLVLSPAALVRAKGNESFLLRCSENEYFVNSTLLEFLKQEFNIDVRGLGGDVSQLKIAEILAMVRAETASMKGWDVVNDVYLACFSFQNYLMWNDIRRHIDELKKNKLVAALLAGRAQKEEIAALEEDDADPEKILLPLPSDSSQFSAVSLSAAGASFVLHGPPGTGKSQTITNIIANALADGKRVLFVAEKKAALDVVKKRLDSIGIGEFCLELHSNKTNKSDVLRRIESTLALPQAEQVSLSERAEEIAALRKELRLPVEALHKKRRLGVSVYQAILLYLQARNAPDILDIESSFYDTLTEKKLIKCKNSILSAAAAAKECGGVNGSPFENVNLFEFSQELRDRVFCASEVVIAEIRHLKNFLALFLEFYRQRISTFTERKLRLLCEIAEGLLAGKYDKYFSGVREEQFSVFYNSSRFYDSRLAYYSKHFKVIVDIDMDVEELRKIAEEGDWKSSPKSRAVVKRLMRASLHEVSEEDVGKYLSTLCDLYDAKRRFIENTALSKNFVDRGGKLNFKKRNEFLKDLYDLHQKCALTFMDYAPDAFNGMCIRATTGYTVPVLEGYLKAAESFFRAQESFLNVIGADRNKIREDDVLEYYSSKAGALIDNIDMLPNWCMYRKTTKELASLGLTFISDALESGRLKGENVLAGFEKNVYKNFLEINIPADPDLSRMTVGTLEETIEKFRICTEEFSRVSREYVRAKLLNRLPSHDEEGPLSVEAAAFTRLSKTGLRGVGIRGLFAEVPALMEVACPCMLMSPSTVAQYLPAEANLFDMVIFDEASQMSTAEAVGSIARAKAAIVVGDPKQLPPTSFFHTAYVDEEEEQEDLESVLDDCLALGMTERHLLWHYRSKHESLIAFSNSTYYDNRLCTFPSPDVDSKVKLIEVDGTYDRGFTKSNRKEAEALVKEVIARLKDPVLSRLSMGIVTFSGAQQDYIERLLNKELAANKLEGAAFDCEEPVFVKNLENVQGDERDVILFSVCYGPGSTGRVSLNFGPLNQAGGWRRLNVAVSRAREEMLIYTSMTAGMIDLRRTSSKGVAGLKAFLDFAKSGKTAFALKSSTLRSGNGIGKFIAQELAGCGYDCRYDVGVSDFKVDVAVIDPKNKHRFLLGILCDGTNAFSVKDRSVLQVQSLKRGNWNVMRMNSVNYFNNPKREIKRVKDVLDKLTGTQRKGDGWINKYKKPYRAVKGGGTENAAFITCGENDAEITARIREIVATEEPISHSYLKKRVLQTFGVIKSGSKVDVRLDDLILSCALSRDRISGVDYYYKNPRALALGKFRAGGEHRRGEEDITVYELLSFVKGALEEKVALYMDEIYALAAATFEVRSTEKLVSAVRDAVAYGEEKGLFVRSVSDRVSFA